MSRFIQLLFDYNNTASLKVTTIAHTIFTMMHKFPYVYFANPLDHTPWWYFVFQILSTIGKEVVELHDCLMDPTINYYVKSMRSTRFWHLKDLGGCSCRRTLDWVDFMIIFVSQCCFKFMLKFMKRWWMKQRSNCQSVISQEIFSTPQMSFSRKHIWLIIRKRMMK